MSIVVTIILFSILIVIHEFGHFLAAKQARVKVERFAVGFGPPLLKIKGKETDFMICLFPLGGYVKLAGDSRSEHKGLKYEFLSQPAGVKMRIVFAGPFSNYLLALLLLIVVAFTGFPYTDTVVGTVFEDYPAYEAGIKEGDKIIEVNGKSVDNWSEMSQIVYSARDEVSLKLERDSEVISLRVPLQKKSLRDNFGQKKKVSIMGISASRIKIVKYGFPEALYKAVESLFELTFLIIKGFALIILGKIPLKEAVAGPIGIYYITSETVKVGLVAILQLAVILNLSLSIINLFPIPIFDGGHLMFFLIEKLRGKPLSEKVEDVMNRIGLAIIIFLFVFVFYSDIIKFGPKILGLNKEDKSLPENVNNLGEPDE